MITLTDDEILPISLQHTFCTWLAQGSVSPIPVKRANGVYGRLAIGDEAVEHRS